VTNERELSDSGFDGFAIGFLIAPATATSRQAIHLFYNLNLANGWSLHFQAFKDDE
jgi:hypothetical protein